VYLHWHVSVPVSQRSNVCFWTNSSGTHHLAGDISIAIPGTPTSDGAGWCISCIISAPEGRKRAVFPRTLRSCQSVSDPDLQTAKADSQGFSSNRHWQTANETVVMQSLKNGYTFLKSYYFRSPSKPTKPKLLWDTFLTPSELHWPTKRYHNYLLLYTVYINVYIYTESESFGPSFKIQNHLLIYHQNDFQHHYQ
jgi:hypothetical protein